VVVVVIRRSKMSVRIKAVVDRFVKELKEALDADIQDRVMKEREMQSYIDEREREVSEREAAWKAELSRREVRNPQIQSMVRLFLGSRSIFPCHQSPWLAFCIISSVLNNGVNMDAVTAGFAFIMKCIHDLTV
jgi:hypothetical protein